MAEIEQDLLLTRVLVSHKVTTHVLAEKSDYNAFNVYHHELAPGTVSLTGDRAQGDDSKHWANSNAGNLYIFLSKAIIILQLGKIKNKCVLGNRSENFRLDRHTYIFF